MRDSRETRLSSDSRHPSKRSASGFQERTNPFRSRIHNPAPKLLKVDRSRSNSEAVGNLGGTGARGTHPAKPPVLADSEFRHSYNLPVLKIAATAVRWEGTRRLNRVVRVGAGGGGA